MSHLIILLPICQQRKIKLEDMSKDIFFPGEFIKDFQKTSIEPSYNYSINEPWDEGKQYATIPIQELCHTTHKENAEEIKKSDEGYKGYYNFQPTMKMTARSRVDCETERPRTRKDKKQEQHLSTPKYVFENYHFPGYLSWWSIDVQHWYKTDEGKRLRTAVRELECNNIYVPHTIQATPTSRYGNHRFSISFEDIVTSYVTSRLNCKSKNVYLLKAGTLVYTYEICYVVMVCIENDRNEIDELNKMPVLHIINNGEDDTVDVSTTLKSLSFKAKHIVMAKYPNEERYCYEELAFAFYFKSNNEKLRCEESKVTSSVVDHQPKYCVKNYQCPC